jgi:hypothetical protein
MAVLRLIQGKYQGKTATLPAGLAEKTLENCTD